jgi:hypothetical protein
MNVYLFWTWISCLICGFEKPNIQEPDCWQTFTSNSVPTLLSFSFSLPYISFQQALGVDPSIWTSYKLILGSCTACFFVFYFQQEKPIGFELTFKTSASIGSKQLMLKGIMLNNSEPKLTFGLSIQRDNPLRRKLTKGDNKHIKRWQQANKKKI